MFQRSLPAVPPQLFTSNGSTNGRVTIAKPWLFKFRQRVLIVSNTQPIRELEVKRVEDSFLFVGPTDYDPTTREDISAYTTADAASIYAVEQTRPLFIKNQSYTFDDLEHEEEPTVARRSLLVDAGGRPIDSVLVDGRRALAVDATVSFGASTITVNQGTNPWIVSQGINPWVVNQGTTPWRVINDHPPVDIETAVFTVNSSPVTDLIPTVHTRRADITIQNTGTQLVYIGPATVTYTNGFRILPHGSFTFTLGPFSKIYAVTESGTCEVRLIKLIWTAP